MMMTRQGSSWYQRQMPNDLIDINIEKPPGIIYLIVLRKNKECQVALYDPSNGFFSLIYTRANGSEKVFEFDDVTHWKVMD